MRAAVASDSGLEFAAKTIELPRCRCALYIVNVVEALPGAVSSDG